MTWMDIEKIRHLRARLRQVDRTIREIDREGLSDSLVDTLLALRRELKDIGHAIEALQSLERSRSTEDPNVTAIKRTRRRSARRPPP